MEFAAKQPLNLLSLEFMHYLYKNEGNSTKDAKEDED